MEEITATGDPHQWVAVTTRHRSGAVGQAALSITTPLPQGLWRCEVYARGEVRRFDADSHEDPAAMRAALLDEFVAAAREGRPARIDAERGLHVQRLLDRAHASLRRA